MNRPLIGQTCQANPDSVISAPNPKNFVSLSGKYPLTHEATADLETCRVAEITTPMAPTVGEDLSRRLD